MQRLLVVMGGGMDVHALGAAEQIGHPAHVRQLDRIELADKQHLVRRIGGEVLGNVQILAGEILVNEKNPHQIALVPRFLSRAAFLSAPGSPLGVSSMQIASTAASDGASQASPPMTGPISVPSTKLAV